MSPAELLKPLLAAFLAGGGVLAAAMVLGLWKLEAGRRMVRWLAPAAGYLVGAWLVRDLPSLPPREAAGWIFWTVALLGVAGLALPSRPHAWIAWPCRVVAASILIYLLAQPMIGRTWEEDAAIIWPVSLIAGTAAAWAFLVRGHGAEPAWRYIGLLLLATAGLSILLMIGGVASYSLFALGLAGGIAGGSLGALPLVHRLAPASRPGPAMVCLPWSGLLAAGTVYADVPPASALLALVSLAALMLPSVPKLNNLGPVKRTALQGVWLLLFLAAAIAWAHHNAPSFDY